MPKKLKTLQKEAQKKKEALERKQNRLMRKTKKLAPLLGRRGAPPMPSFVENRLVELGIKEAQPSAHDAFLQSRSLLSQIINPFPR
jgi:hypothetical protein